MDEKLAFDVLIDVVENACNARFVHQKLRLYAETRGLLEGPAFFPLLYELFEREDDAVPDWLAQSLPEPAVFLAKYLLVLGFYASRATDLRALADAVLDSLEAQALAAIPSSASLYHSTAQPGPFM